MKRVLRVLILGPLMVVFLILLTAVHPLVRVLDWLWDTPAPENGGLRPLWSTMLRDVWG